MTLTTHTITQLREFKAQELALAQSAEALDNMPKDADFDTALEKHMEMIEQIGYKARAICSVICDSIKEVE